MSDNRHENYEILNLLGYGLAKFDSDFVKAFGFETKTAFYESMVSKGVADTIGTIKNGRIYLPPFLITSEKAGGKKGILICTEKHLLTCCL
jgi:hypothetical protein